ncbi:hypothetical protein [Brevibacterium casei]|uniref:Uncharacterized protein n=1 Tax=Brevibacterium casei TaxID=33889 RepID=A0A7T4A1H0_9MICO|nr:hypothetical protein [Brevibacterium casei]QQB15569.1 hypothetical protein I6H47_06465 [Brevibacterium casei]
MSGTENDDSLAFERNHGCRFGECGIQVIDVVMSEGIGKLVRVGEGVIVSHALEVLRELHPETLVQSTIIEAAAEDFDDFGHIRESEDTALVCAVLDALEGIEHLEPDATVSLDLIRRGLACSWEAYHLEFNTGLFGPVA